MRSSYTEAQQNAPHRFAAAALLILAMGLFIRLNAATQIYVAASSAGANNGTSCGNARAYTSLVGGDYAGNTIHVCGTITGSANTTLFTVGGDGATILFETGAILQSPVFPYPDGGITCNGHSGVTIDGGSNGLMRNTADGTSLANHTDSVAINGNQTNCSNFTVKNLHFYMYDKVQNNTSDAAAGTVIAVQLSGNNTLVTHNTVDHSRYAFYMGYISTSNVEMSFNVTTFTENGALVGDQHGGATIDGIKIHDNDFGGGAYLWDSGDSSNAFHHDPVHIFCTGVGSTATNIQIYGNYVHGSWGQDTAYFAATGGTHITSVFYIENAGPAEIFNNVVALAGALSMPDDGYIYLKASQSNNSKVFQNAFTSDGHGTAISLTSSGHDIRNNIFSGFEIATYTPPGTSVAVSDHNDYFGTSGFGNFDTYAGWQANGFDTHSTQADPKLDGTFHLLSGSAAIGLGQNLTSLGIAELDRDKSGTARPGSGAWDAGAFNAGAAAPTISITITPNPLALGSVNVLATSSATATVTNTSTSATVVLANPFMAITGPQAPEFTRTSGSCGNGTSLAAAATCTIAIQFAPTSASPPARAAVLTVNTTTAGVSASINLSGTAVAPGSLPFTFSPTSLSFGAFNVGVQSGLLTTVVTNPNAATTILSTIALSGTNAGDFAILGVDCVAGTTSLPTAAHCTVGLKFTPGNSGSRSATLTVSGTNSVTGTVALSGTGNAPTGLPGDLPGPALKMFVRGFHDSSTPSVRYFLAREVSRPRRDDFTRHGRPVLAGFEDERRSKEVLAGRFHGRRRPVFFACGERTDLSGLPRVGLALCVRHDSRQSSRRSTS